MILTDNGFTVSDNMSNYSNVDYIVEAKIAVIDDIEIEMVKYTTNDYATAVQDKQIESFNLLKSTGAHEDKEKGSNYYKYVLVWRNTDAGYYRNWCNCIGCYYCLHLYLQR